MCDMSGDGKLMSVERAAEAILENLAAEVDLAKGTFANGDSHTAQAYTHPPPLPSPLTHAHTYMHTPASQATVSCATCLGTGS